MAQSSQRALRVRDNESSNMAAASNGRYQLSKRTLLPVGLVVG